MEEESFHDQLEAAGALESAATSAYLEQLPRVESLLEQHRQALQLLGHRMAVWAIWELEMSAVSAELLVLDDASAGMGEGAARLRGIRTMVELNLIKAGHRVTPEDFDEAIKQAEGAQEHLRACSARVRAMVRCFQEVARVGEAGGAEQAGVIAGGELGLAQKSLDAAVDELKATQKSTADVRDLTKPSAAT